MTFGQPRIGNAAFVSYYSELVPNTIRVTHDHDIVPHLPPYYRYLPRKTYKHFPREVILLSLGWIFVLDFIPKRPVNWYYQSEKYKNLNPRWFDWIL